MDKTMFKKLKKINSAKLLIFKFFKKEAKFTLWKHISISFFSQSSAKFSPKNKIDATNIYPNLPYFGPL